MNHIKSYKIFESIDYHIKVVKDLLSDISDEDITVTVTDNISIKANSKIPDTILVSIGNFDEPKSIPNISKYKSNLDNVNEYLNGEDFKLIGFCGESDEEEYIDEITYTIDQLMNEISSKSMMYITLHYILEDDAHLEKIEVPIEVGDTVLGGRFKNKKMVVKKIGKNKKGDITINDKPLLKFRLVKEGLKDDVDYYFRHLEDDGFCVDYICGTEFYGTDGRSGNIRFFKPLKSTNYTYSNCKPFEWSEIAGELSRYVNDLEGKSISYFYVIDHHTKKNDLVISFNRKQLDPQVLLDDTFDAGEILSCTIGLYWK